MKTDKAPQKKMVDPISSVATPQAEEGHVCPCERGEEPCSDCVQVREPKKQGVTIFTKPLVR